MDKTKCFYVVPVPRVALYDFNYSVAKEELIELKRAFNLVNKKKYIHRDLERSFYRQDLVDAFREDVISSLKKTGFKNAEDVFDIITMDDKGYGLKMVFRNKFYLEISKVLELEFIIKNIVTLKRYLNKYLTVVAEMERIKESKESFGKNKKIKKDYETLKKDKKIKTQMKSLKEWQEKLADAESFYGVKVNI